MKKVVTMAEGDLQRLKGAYFESFNRNPLSINPNLQETAFFFPNEQTADDLKGKLAQQGLNPSPSVFGQENNKMVERIEGEDHRTITVLNYRNSDTLTDQLQAAGYEAVPVKLEKHSGGMKRPSELLSEIKEKMGKIRIEEMGIRPAQGGGRGR